MKERAAGGKGLSAPGTATAGTSIPGVAAARCGVRAGSARPQHGHCPSRQAPSEAMGGGMLLERETLKALGGLQELAAPSCRVWGSSATDGLAGNTGRAG